MDYLGPSTVKNSLFICEVFKALEYALYNNRYVILFHIYHYLLTYLILFIPGVHKADHIISDIYHIRLKIFWTYDQHHIFSVCYH